MKKFTIHFILILLITNYSTAQFSISGVISYQGSPVPGVRMTLFNTDTTYFEEERSNNSGVYQFINVPGGTYTVGVAKPDYAYVDSVRTINSNVSNFNIFLSPETEKGNWDIIVQSPEALGGTDLGVLMPNGTIYYCHNTTDPFFFDPVTNDTIAAPGSNNTQGCVGPLLLGDGKVWFFGGTLQEIYGPGTRQTKSFEQSTGIWQIKNNMIDYRWYPTVSPLPDGRVLIVGGGGLNNPIRVKTSEIYNTVTGISTAVDTIAIGNEVSPIIPLLTGKTLMTHRPPQLFDPATNQWNLAADFVQSNRMSNGDHSDHELVLMPDGNVIAIGYKSFNANLGTFVERYNPVANTWSLKSSIAPIRSRAKAVLLPDKKILVAGGYKEDAANNTPVNQWNYMKRADLYNVAADTWRQADEMNYFREYHAIATLVPDGRVIVVGGEGAPGNEPSQSIIEAYSPPYLYRGVRPEITNLNNTTFARGNTMSFDVSKTDSVTSVQLMSTAVNTHFMNSSNNRFLELSFSQTNGTISTILPVDSILMPPGYYMLFAMVDDIPSIAKIVKINQNCILTPVITGDSNVCSNETAIYTAPVYTNAGYTWTVIGGNILTGQGTNQITVSWNNGITGAVSLVVQE